MSLLIIDGVIATGKTSLLNQLQMEPELIRIPTKQVISEHITERVLEGRSPSTDDRLTLLQKTLNSIEGLHGIIKESKFAGLPQYAPCAILERFHLTHAANDTKLQPYLELEPALMTLDAHLVFLYHSEESLAERIEETRRHRGQHWCAYLDRFGGQQGAIDHFRSLQERSWAMYSSSILPKAAYEARSHSISDLGRQVIDFWLLSAGRSHKEAPCDSATS